MYVGDKALWWAQTLSSEATISTTETGKPLCNSVVQFMRDIKPKSEQGANWDFIGQLKCFILLKFLGGKIPPIVLQFLIPV